MFNLQCNSCEGIYNTSLDVRFTKACDNNCAFCIEKTGIRSLGKSNVDALIASTIESGKTSIGILGGEPFLLVKELYAYIVGIREHVKSIYITTSLPKTLDITNPLVLQILELVDGINVSLQSHNYIDNNKVLVASSNHDRVSQLAGILTKIDSDTVRVSINLVKGNIDTKEKLLTCLNHLRAIGVSFVKINELMDSELHVSFTKIMDVTLGSAYATGCQTEIQLIPDMRIILKRACFIVEDSIDITFPDVLKAVTRRLLRKKPQAFKVLYENGSLENGWLQKDCS